MPAPRWFLLALVVSLAVGFALRNEVVDAGFWADDYLQYAMRDGTYPAPRAAWDMFRFASGGEDLASLVEYGYYPWWAHPQFKLSMLRPLPSLLHTLDYQWFGKNARAHHLHSMLWWALCVLAAGLLLFHTLPRAAAACALVLFALDEGHVIPLVWIANRSALIASAFTLAGLYCYLRYRRDGARWGAPLCAAMLTLAFASGEYTFTAFGFVIAAEIFLGRGSAPERIRALWPALLPAAAFALAWLAGGYGSAHSGYYTSPVQSPVEYAAKVLVGVPVLVGDLVWAIPADFFSFGSPWEAWLARLGPGMPSWWMFQLVIGALALPAGYHLVRVLGRRLPEAHAAALHMFAAGALLGLLPALGSFVSSRLLCASSLGTAALFGSALAALGGSLRRALRARALPTVIGSALALCALGFVQCYRPIVNNLQAVHRWASAAQARTAWPMSTPIAPHVAAQTDLVMISSADPNDAAYVPFARHLHGHPMLHGFRLLSGVTSPHALRRIDDHTIELSVLQPFATAGTVAGSLTRSANEPLGEGSRVVLHDVTVEVLAALDGQPTTTRFRFAKRLDDPTLMFVQPTARGIQPFALPPNGEQALVLAPVLPSL